MEKQIKYDTIFKKQYPYEYSVTFSDIINCGIELCESDEISIVDDEISIVDDEGFQSENNSWDAHTMLIIQRPRFETDGEYNERVRMVEVKNKWQKEERYKSYLKLKKEFENDTP